MNRIAIANFVYKAIIIGLFSIFACFLVWSEFGLIKHYSMGNSLKAKRKELVVLKNKIATLEHEIENWKRDKFYLEKMAREELCMGYDGEMVYLLKK